MIEPLLIEEPPKPKGGRPRVPDRAALTGILFVFKRGIPWEMLPRGDGLCFETTWQRSGDDVSRGVLGLPAPFLGAALQGVELCFQVL